LYLEVVTYSSISASQQQTIRESLLYSESDRSYAAFTITDTDMKKDSEQIDESSDYSLLLPDQSSPSSTSDEYDISEGLKQGAPRIAQDSDLCGSTPSFQAPDRSQCRQSGLQVRWLKCPIHEQFLAQ
jgi:hypothetical protein